MRRAATIAVGVVVGVALLPGLAAGIGLAVTRHNNVRRTIDLEGIRAAIIAADPWDA